jgi:hypothetical protein
MKTHLATPPHPVGIIDQTDWWQPYVPPLVGLVGSIIVAAAAFVGVVTNTRTNQRAIDAADTRHREQLVAARVERAADRAADRADKFREEVASILAERWPMLNATYELACAVEQYRRVRGNPRVSATEQEVKSKAVKLVQRDHLNRLIQLTIRAGLLTNDREIQTVLKELREMSRDAWNAINQTLNFRGNPFEEAHAFRKRLQAKLSDLESLTRELVTTDGTKPSAVQTD